MIPEIWKREADQVWFIFLVKPVKGIQVFFTLFLPGFNYPGYMSIVKFHAISLDTFSKKTSKQLSRQLLLDHFC